MIRRIINKIKRSLTTDSRQKPYPYRFLMPEFNLSFLINNGIEEFRLKDWGGEKEYVVAMMNDLKSADIFYDIGASVGLVSILASKTLTEGKVISFEPDPENVSRLKANYLVNKLNNFTIKEIAVGNKRETLKLFTAGSNGYSPSLKQVNGIDRSIEVPVHSIDELLSSKEVPYPTVIKIDIEGAEFLALNGMRQLLGGEHAPRLLFIELHPDFLPSFNTTVEEIMNFLSQFNYTVAENIQRDKQILVKLIHKRNS